MSLPAEAGLPLLHQIFSVLRLILRIGQAKL